MVGDDKETKTNGYGKALSRLCLMSLLLEGETLSTNSPPTSIAQCPISPPSADLVKSMKAWGIPPSAINEKLKHSQRFILRKVCGTKICSIPVIAIPVCAHPVCAHPVCIHPVCARKQTLCKPCTSIRKPGRDIPGSTSDRDTPGSTSDRGTPGNTSDRDTPGSTSDRDTPGSTSDRDTPGTSTSNGGTGGDVPPPPRTPPWEPQQPFTRTPPPVGSSLQPQPIQPQQIQPQLMQSQPIQLQQGRPQIMQPPQMQPQPGMPIMPSPLPSGSIMPPLQPRPIPSPLQIPPMMPSPIMPQPRSSIPAQPILPRAATQPQRPTSLPARPSAITPPGTPLTTPTQKPPSPTRKPVSAAPSSAVAPAQRSKAPSPEISAPPPPAAKPTVAVVQPNIPTILRPDAKSKTLQDALKNLSLPRTPIESTAMPDVPPVIKPRPYGSIPTSQPFYLPEKPPEGHSPLATQIQEHLKKRPPIHEPDEVIGEDVSIKDAKEQ